MEPIYWIRACQAFTSRHWQQLAQVCLFIRENKSDCHYSKFQSCFIIKQLRFKASSIAIAAKDELENTFDKNYGGVELSGYSGNNEEYSHANIADTLPPITAVDKLSINISKTIFFCEDQMKDRKYKCFDCILRFHFYFYIHFSLSTIFPYSTGFFFL